MMRTADKLPPAMRFGRNAQVDRHAVRIALLTACLCLGCGDGGGNKLSNANCPEGYDSHGPACVPIFDDCPGSTELAVLGGGCRTVGVTACATDLFTSDGEGGCEPILPPGPQDCPPGTTAQLGRTDCLPVGVPACAPGFEPDGAGGCDAVLPPGPDPCPAGTMEVLGHTGCRPVGDCGTGTWGNVVGDPTTLYVDQTADATGADGTPQAPYVTILDALAVVADGGQIAVAAGEYNERLMISSPVRLAGRCSELVTIRGSVLLGQPLPPVSIGALAGGTTIRGVTLTGPGRGLVIIGAHQVAVEEVEVVGTGDVGIRIAVDGAASLRRVKVADTAYTGVLFKGSSLEVDECVIRDTRAATDALLGRGIEAQCDPDTGTCGTVLVTSSLVSGNREIGIGVFGVDAEIRSTVVRDTLPQDDDNRFGRGIATGCTTAGECGTLVVSGCLVANNRESGILTSGADTVISRTVVRDTRAQLSNDTLGWGITAGCAVGLGTCGTLSVTESLVAGNTGMGLYTTATSTTVTGTVVRDTLPQPSDGMLGWGVAAHCDLDLQQCGTFDLIDSLVEGNVGAGLFFGGVDATVRGVQVRDTLPRSDGETGDGIAAECLPAVPLCGALTVEGCLVAGNRQFGIVTQGMDTTVTGSLVRDTLPRESDLMFGRGIGSQCHVESGVCGTLRVEGSVVAGNRSLGISGLGADVVVERTVVRDTLPRQLGGINGSGIGVTCDPDTGACGSLRLEDSLISGNREVGIFTEGPAVTVTRTVVRDTVTRDATTVSGAGIGAQCFADLGVCPALTVVDSLLSGNHDQGIAAWSATLSVTGTVVRDTRPRTADGAFGRGITSHCDPRMDQCGSLALDSTLVQSSEDAGIFVYGVPTTMVGVAVRDTLSNATGPFAGKYGQGIYALCSQITGDCATLQMTSCHVETSHGAGIATDGYSGFITSTLVDQVFAEPDEGKYGFGIQVAGTEDQIGQAMIALNIIGCAIVDAKLAGILYYRSRGTLTGSLISGAENSVIMNEGSDPTILGDNELSGTVQDAPTWASMFPSPAPPPALPYGTNEVP
ncbi:MAG: right-handed parallel beta-helix repeat-containing protein [bacterium]